MACSEESWCDISEHQKWVHVSWTATVGRTSDAIYSRQCISTFSLSPSMFRPLVVCFQSSGTNFFFVFRDHFFSRHSSSPGLGNLSGIMSSDTVKCFESMSMCLISTYKLSSGQTYVASDVTLRRTCMCATETAYWCLYRAHLGSPR